MSMVCPFVKAISCALETGLASRLGLKGPKVHQQRPPSQPGLRRLKVPVQRAVGVQQPIQAVHGTVHRVARAVAPRATISTVPDHSNRLIVNGASRLRFFQW